MNLITVLFNLCLVLIITELLLAILSYKNVDIHNSVKSFKIVSPRYNSAKNDSFTRFVNESRTIDLCGKIKRPIHIAADGAWQKVKVYDTAVYSAFHDDRFDVIRIVGISDLSEDINVKCQVWYKKSSYVHVTSGTVDFRFPMYTKKR